MLSPLLRRFALPSSKLTNRLSYLFIFRKRRKENKRAKRGSCIMFVMRVMRLMEWFVVNPKRPLYLRLR